jgi:glycosyltransferase involved in cell wall biosynthesis
MPVRDNSYEVLVTVITVTYNSSAYVRDAIESVLAQSHSHIQYIIGDDCSTDETWKIIQEYQDTRIKAYRNEMNLREYPNRNKAIRLATGKYVLFIDGDDVLYPHGLEFMVRMAESFPESGMTMMRPFHPKLIYPVEITPHTVFVAEYFNRSLVDIALTNTLFKTDVLRQVKMGNSFYISEDTFVRLQIAKNNKCLLINDNLTWWRITPGQATSKLANNIEALVQHVEYKTKLLDSSAPLSAEEQRLAVRNLEYKVAHRALGLLLKLKLRQSFLLLKRTGLLWKGLRSLTYKYTSIDPFANYSATHPWKRDFSDHPYSSLPRN